MQEVIPLGADAAPDALPELLEHLAGRVRILVVASQDLQGHRHRAAREATSNLQDLWSFKAATTGDGDGMEMMGDIQNVGTLEDD